MMAIHEGFNPPFPENVEDLLENSQKGFGSRLLNTVRCLEKILVGSQSSSDADTDDTIDNAVSLFNQLISLFSRRGMLHGSRERAEKILSSVKTSVKTKRPKGNKNNKQKNKNLSMDASNDTESANSSGYEQEALLFTAILRVLNMENNADDSSIFQNDRNLILALTAELCVAICQFVQKSNPSDACCQAEYELILQSGKPLLTGLLNSMRSLKSDIQASTKDETGNLRASRCLTLAQLDADRHVDPLVSCLKATSTLVSLFGTKLSRSTKLLSDLRQIAWTFLTINDPAVQTSTARLLATLPVAGGTDRTSPSDLWNQTMEDVIDLLARSTKAMAPLKSTNKKKDDSNLAEESRTAYQLWWKFVKEDLSDEMDRALSFRCFLFGLTSCFQSLLLLDGIVHETNAPLLSGAQLNVESILGVIETFVTFPLSAETLLYKTKKRLRNESIDGGLLSPRIASTMLGNDLKTLGHNLLDTLLQCVGGSVLLPFSTRITRISYASLITSCSGVLRKALDPTRSSSMDGKKRKWLHQSIALRKVAVTTLTASISLFGIGKKEKSATSSRPSRSEAEKAVEFVVGCFLEEVKRGSEASGQLDESWGSSSERVSLIVAALGCLRTVLVACGGFLDISTRSLIDSTVLTGLMEMAKENRVLSSPSATIGMLELSLCCITTPWNDGSMTALYDSIVRVARRCENNTDVNVCKSAKSLVMACNSISVPRAPALLYVSRATASQQPQEPTPERAASDLVNDLEKARAEIARAQRIEEEMKKKKAEEKRRRQNEEAEENIRKRKKVEIASQQKQDAPKPTNPKLSPKEDHMVESKTEEMENEAAQPSEPSVEEKPESPEPAVAQQQDTDVKDDESHDTAPSDKEDTPMEEADDDNFDFPEIVEGGGPDSDDE